jgi:predicted acetyltransferase
VTDFRPFQAGELATAHRALELAFGSDPHASDLAVDEAVLPLENTLGAWDGDTVIATGGYYDLPMTIPGGTLDVAGVTWISVAPTHHRQGILSALMARQLGDLHDRGRPVAALWASEGAIYQRFGYGPASWHYSLELRRGAPFTRPVDVSGLRVVVPTAAELAPLYDAHVGTRPGWYAQSEAWWDYRLYDAEHRRGGATSLRAVIDGDRGYALYRTKAEWGANGPDGTVQVGEVVALDPGTEARLWRFLLDQDLMGRVKAWGTPLDTPVLQLVAEPRAVKATLADAMWVRLVDVPTALATRCYAVDVDVVLEVTDARCPWNAGRWRLSGGPSGAVCSSTSDAADLALDVRELGAAFLGGTSLGVRASAGWVTGSASALEVASRAFAWPGRVAHAPMVF